MCLAQRFLCHSIEQNDFMLYSFALEGKFELKARLFCLCTIRIAKFHQFDDMPYCSVVFD